MGRPFLTPEQRELSKRKREEYQSEYREREGAKERVQTWHKENRERSNEIKKNWEDRNKESRKEYLKKYNEENRDKKRAQRIRWKKGYTKKSKTYEILGLSFEEFKIYLESKFESWMTWENYGLYNGELNHGWDIDHIIPIMTSKSEDDVIKLNHHINLQPLCSKVNRDIKRDKA